MSILRVRDPGLYLFENPSQHSDSDRVILEKGDILLSFAFVPEGTQLHGHRWPADYDWYLVVTSNRRTGWVAAGSRAKLFESHLEKLE